MELISIKFGKAKIETTDASAGDVFVCSPERNLAKSLGIVFGVLELTGLPDQFNEAFFEIISDLKTEYYLPPFNVESGLEKRFEECIQRANRRIHKAINESVDEVDASGINALIGLTHKSTLHMAYVGGVKANLLHMRKDGELVTVDILNNEKAKANPEKLFHDIVSGQISGRDVVFIISENTSRFISGADIIDIAEGNPLSLAGEAEGLLRSQGQDNNFYLLTIEPDYERVDAQEPARMARPSAQPSAQAVHRSAPEHSLNSLITTQKRTEKYLTPSSMPSWQKILLFIYKGIRAGALYLSPKIKKFIIYAGKQTGKGIAFLAKFIYVLIARKPSGPAPAAPAGTHGAGVSRPIDSAVGNSSRPENSAPTGEIYSQDLILNPSPIESAAPQLVSSQKDFFKTYPDHKSTATILMPEQMKAKGLLGAISNQLNKILYKIYCLSKKQKIILLLSFVLIFAFSESVVLIGQATEPKPPKASQVAANQIEEQINLADAQNIFNDSEGAKAAIAKAQELLDQIPGTKSNEALIQDLQVKINSTRASIEKISSIDNPQILFDLKQAQNASGAQAIALAGGNILVSGGTGGYVSKIDLDKKEVASNALGEQGINITKIIPIDSSNFLLLDPAKGVYKYSAKDSSLASLISATDGLDMAYYSSHIYFLQNGKESLTKYLLSGNKATGAASALKDSANLPSAGAISINGEIYVFQNSGKIIKYNKGAVSDIKFSELTPALRNPLQLYADSKDNLFVLDQAGNKIAIYNPDGSLKLQITSPKFTSLKSMAVDEQGKKIYLLSDDKIFVINTGF